jgi:hypothetical protein
VARNSCKDSALTPYSGAPAGGWITVSRKWQTGYGTRLTAVCLVALLATALGPALRPAVTNASGDSWFYFPGGSQPLKFANSEQVLVDGERDATGECGGPFALTQEPGGPPLGAVLLAIDLMTCQQLVEVGELAQVPADPSGPGYASSPPEKTAGDVEAPAALASEEVLWHYYVIWKDPLAIPVTKVQQNLRWTYDGSHILSLISATDSRSWFTPSGWTETYHHKSVYHDSRYAYITTDNTFYNQPFCGGTWIFYSPQTLLGRWNGTATGSVYTAVSGCGANLLQWYSYIWMW